MHFSDPSSEASRPFLAESKQSSSLSGGASSTWQNIIDWAQIHYRDRIFRKDEQIPARPELLYLVNKGAIRLVGVPQGNANSDRKSTPEPELTAPNSDLIEEAFLGFVNAGQPFEVVAQSSFVLQAYAHVDRTQVIWLYWQDLENWPNFSKQVYEALRYQHQRKLLWLSALGQRKTIDRLTSFLTLLIEEYGIIRGQNHCLPYTLTHAQIGSAIGSTRVTVTRLMGKLQRQGIIFIQEDRAICMLNLLPQNQDKRS